MQKTTFLLPVIIALFGLSACLAKSGKLERHRKAATQFSNAYGGTATDYATCMTSSSDGGYVIAGTTNSHDGDVIASSKYKSPDAWMVKLDSMGRIVWQKALGRSTINEASSIIATSDRNYIMVGKTNKNDGAVTGMHGATDAWVVKLNDKGSVVWEKTLGGSGVDGANSVVTTSDGGYVMAGYTSSRDGDVKVSGKYEGEDAWIVKLDSRGRMKWQRTLGSQSDTTGIPASITTTLDGGYLVAGNTYTENYGNTNGPHGVNDIWVAKLDSRGGIVWQKLLGGSSSDYATSITTTLDGGCVMAGRTSSNDGEVSGNHGLWDAWVVRLDSSGRIVWQKTFGGPSSDYANFITRSGDGNYLMAGYTILKDGILTGNYDNDAWIVKLDDKGNMLWQETLGGSRDDQAISIIERPNGVHVIAGLTNSMDGDISGNHGGFDAWLAAVRHP